MTVPVFGLPDNLDEVDWEHFPEGDEAEAKAELTSERRNALPDSAFACPSKRKYPIHDKAHIRNALSRCGDPSNDQCGCDRVRAAARKAGIGVESKAVLGKSLMPLHADPVDAKAFLDGTQAWRMLAIPFGGPIASPVSPKGVDIDGQWFSERTDLIAGYEQLRSTRERVVDWHHSLAPVNGRGGDPRGGLMNGVVLGKAVIDEEPDEAGWWADFWVTAGEKKRQLLDRLVQRAASLYTSAQPVVPGKADPATGEILSFPAWAFTITTAPQNHLAVVTPKALLAELDSAELSVSPALRTLLAELDALGAELPRTLPSGGVAAVKAGGVSTVLRDLEPSLAPFEALRDALRESQPID